MSMCFLSVQIWTVFIAVAEYAVGLIADLKKRGMVAAAVLYKLAVCIVQRMKRRNDLLVPCLLFNGLEAMRASAGIVPICDASPVHFPCAAAIVALDTHIAHDFLLSHAETPRR